MPILEAIFNLFTSFFKSLGTFASINPCTGFFDEPEVPQELSKAE
ncbi:cyclic lactone autoinducer peptide AgrD [Staphylococcus ratti]|uniref:Cyclic lactone autoinducer peptide n=1 Tax=Staphylococcus ratti TaxID=2892440 RepID=A0ABY3PEX3_9STAP|nr:cyclic lactone autoinducer peptide [Staphylococcus ratti]UEX90748.1 cyclic lactone autoinducer peptide [Staphylococcus ratti]